jgi:tetratricopeptide (TPR) repeat protein
MKIGDALRAQGKLDDALPHYQSALDIAKSVARRNPESIEFDRDVAIAYAKLARWHRQAGKAERALELFREGRAIMQRVTRLAPEHAGWKGDLAWFDAQIAARDK